MGKEIEFKYLTSAEKLPKDYKSYPTKEIEQAYLNMPGADASKTYRVRKMGNKYFYCVKGEGLIAREESEEEISKEEYAFYLVHKTGNSIHKTRYFIPLGYDDLVAELDVYHDQLDGLYTVEVEFKEDYDLSSFVPPSWFGKDVTKDSRYKNANLAKIDSISSLS